ncbi:MAG: hypothetical protein D6753_17735 [Planctomycetota bacterium]|nr:MAG: hypothetical protein D6753_17735 [Planctomycetota bacterium]
MSSFYPTVGTRATSQQGISRLLFQIHHDQNAILDLQQQLSTGRRVNRLSEDPVAGIKALTAQRQLEFNAQLQDNMQNADVMLSATEATLAQAQSIVNEMRGVAVEATGTTYSEDQRQAFISQIQAAISKLAELGNTRIRDQFLFGGASGSAAALELVGDSVRFRGDETQLLTITDYAITAAANVTAQEAFGVRSEEIVSAVDLDPAVTPQTPLATLNRGAGVPPGSITLSDGTNEIEVDLSNAYDLNDVLRALNANQLGGRGISATLTPSGLQIDYVDGLPGILRIDEVGTGSTAAALGINNSDTLGTSPVTGGDLDPRLTLETGLAQLFQGTGINIGDSFLIEQGGVQYKVSTSGISTVEDLLNRINYSGAQVQASLDADGRSLVVRSLESGTVMSIGENGSNLASKLGLRTFDTTTRVDALNLGQGIYTSDQVDDLVIVRSDGSQFSVDLDGVQTVADVLNRINSHVANFDPALRVTASLATQGNGIVLTAPAGAQPIEVRAVGGSQAAWGLGLVPIGAESSVGAAVGTNSVINGTDVSGVEVDGVFTSLIRMRQALENGKPEDMQRIAAALERDVERLSVARATIGARQQALEQTRELKDHQQLQLRQAESDALDADLAQVISDLTAREAALQASLKTMGQTTRLTLFDYL